MPEAHSKRGNQWSHSQSAGNVCAADSRCRRRRHRTHCNMPQAAHRHLRAAHHQLAQICRTHGIGGGASSMRSQPRCSAPIISEDHQGRARSTAGGAEGVAVDARSSDARQSVGGSPSWQPSHRSKPGRQDACIASHWLAGRAGESTESEKCASSRKCARANDRIE